MKKKKAFMLVFALALLIASSVALLTAATAKTEPNGKGTTEQEKVAPLVIDTKTEQSGKLTIYQDGEVVYQYEGPMKVNRREGRYVIDLQTVSCSCFEGEVEE